MSHRADGGSRPARRSRALLAGLTLLAGVTGFACGDDDMAADDTDDTEQVSTGPELSPEEFRAQGNALCVAYRGRTEELALEAARKEGSGISPTVRELREYVSKTLPEFRTLLKQLKALRAPAAEASTYADLIEAGERAITEAEDIKEDNQRLLSREYGDAFALFNRGAHTLGLESCLAE